MLDCRSHHSSPLAILPPDVGSWNPRTSGEPHVPHLLSVKYSFGSCLLLLPKMYQGKRQREPQTVGSFHNSRKSAHFNVPDLFDIFTSIDLKANITILTYWYSRPIILCIAITAITDQYFLLQGGAVAGTVAHILDLNHGKVSMSLAKNNCIGWI